jgi:hypothetical protein
VLFNKGMFECLDNMMRRKRRDMKIIGKFLMFGDSHVPKVLGGLGKAGCFRKLVAVKRAAKYVLLC